MISPKTATGPLKSKRHVPGCGVMSGPQQPQQDKVYDSEWVGFQGSPPSLISSLWVIQRTQYVLGIHSTTDEFDDVPGIFSVVILSKIK